MKILLTIIGTFGVPLILWFISSLYKKNVGYYKLISEFRDKLPRPQNQGRKLTDNEIDKNPFLPNSLKYVNSIDVSTHKISLTESDLDLFYNKLKNFDYSLVLFSKHYKEYTDEIMRLEPKSENKNFQLVVLQEVLEKNSLHPLKFWEVFIFHVKFRWRLTTYFCTWKIRKKQRDGLRKTKIMKQG
jgi:hypothetical protein